MFNKTAANINLNENIYHLNYIMAEQKVVQS